MRVHPFVPPSAGMTALRPALGLFLLALGGGCAAQVRVSVGPTLDTLGGFGCDIKLSGGLGRGSADTGATLNANLGFGTMDNGNTAALLGGMEISVMHVIANHIGVRGGLQYASRRLFLKPDDLSMNGLGLNIAVLGKLTGGQSPVRSYQFLAQPIRTPGSAAGGFLGAEFQFEYLWGSNLDRGVFSLPFTFEYWTMSGY